MILKSEVSRNEKETETQLSFPKLKKIYTVWKIN